jgi:hypothetical protein
MHAFFIGLAVGVFVVLVLEHGGAKWLLSLISGKSGTPPTPAK